MGRNIILRDPDYFPWAYMRVMLFTLAAIGGVIVPIVLLFQWNNWGSEELLTFIGISLFSLLILFFCWIAIKTQRTYRRLMREGVVTQACFRNHRMVKKVTPTRLGMRKYQWPYTANRTRTSYHYEGDVVYQTEKGETSVRFKSIPFDVDYDQFKSSDFGFQVIYLPEEPTCVAYLPSHQNVILEKMRKSLVWTIVWLLVTSGISVYMVFNTFSDLFYFGREPYWPGFILIPASLVIFIPLTTAVIRRIL